MEECITAAQKIYTTLVIANEFSAEELSQIKQISRAILIHMTQIANGKSNYTITYDMNLSGELGQIAQQLITLPITVDQAVRMWNVCHSLSAQFPPEDIDITGHFVYAVNMFASTKHGSHIQEHVVNNFLRLAEETSSSSYYAYHVDSGIFVLRGLLVRNKMITAWSRDFNPITTSDGRTFDSSCGVDSLTDHQGQSVLPKIEQRYRVLQHMGPVHGGPLAEIIPSN